MRNAKVIIVDDESIVRAGLENWLSQDYEVKSFDSAKSFLDAFEQFEFEDHLPTCILLDLQMPEMNGLELQKTLKLMNAEFPIIFMSGNAQQIDIINAWQGGAADFILKPFTASQITDALDKNFKKISRHKNFASNEIPRKLIDIPITKREAEVLLLLGNGHRQPEVAKLLGIAPRTVKMYRTFLRDKLSLNTLGELIKYCQNYEHSIKRIAEK
ncbi:response regulator transcription factor [Polynucleobacter sp. AP-Titi-500A-B4]|uniref:response regulator transcription factor n=1 Tax=Polynucleobacter sp. AP-Titi-500A-B4 TaxID=2576923 RepID=UPI001BFD0428|nr:response regulator [Polynucleobacter sp. AP-Titi-500A-B4]